MKYKTAFRLAVRAVGVLIVAQSLPSLVTMLVVLGLSFDDISMFVDAGRWYLATAGGHVLAVVIGLYLFFRGNWIVDLAIPSNRPYCHECGYELTGLSPAGVCPECGTAYRREELARPPADNQPH